MIKWLQLFRWKPLPKILKKEAKAWHKLGIRIVYLGKHPDIPGCDVYMTKLPEGERTGFPRVYLVYDDKYDIISDFDAFDVIGKVVDKK